MLATCRKVMMTALAVLALHAWAAPDASMAQPKAPAEADAPSPLPSKRCRIGRRAYCYKYQGLCERDATAACSAWFQACWQCHDAADACRRAGGACEDCRAQWSRCMAAGYAAHWPAKARK